MLSSYETKCSALDALLNIGLEISDSPGVIPKEVRQGFVCDSVLEDTMCEVLEGMTEKESSIFRYERGEEWIDNINELEVAGEGARVFESLGQVRSLLLDVSEEEGIQD